MFSVSVTLATRERGDFIDYIDPRDDWLSSRDLMDIIKYIQARSGPGPPGEFEPFETTGTLISGWVRGAQTGLHENLYTADPSTPKTFAIQAGTVRDLRERWLAQAGTPAQERGSEIDKTPPWFPLALEDVRVNALDGPKWVPLKDNYEFLPEDEHKKFLITVD